MPPRIKIVEYRLTPPPTPPPSSSLPVYAQHVERVWPPVPRYRMVQLGRQTCAVPQQSCNRLHLNVACFWPDLNVPQQNNELIFNYGSYPDYLPVWSPVTDRYQSAFSGYTLLEKTENIDYVKSEILSLQNRPRSIYQYSNMDPGPNARVSGWKTGWKRMKNRNVHNSHI